jgi:hypothetical protein
VRDDDLIAREIEEDVYSPGPADVRLRRSGVHVWAIVGHYLNAVNRDKEAVARDYELSLDEIEAALVRTQLTMAEMAVGASPGGCPVFWPFERERGHPRGDAPTFSLLRPLFLH